MNGTDRKHLVRHLSFTVRQRLKFLRLWKRNCLSCWVSLGVCWISIAVAVRSFDPSLFGRLNVQRDELLLRFLCAFLDMLPQCRQIEGRMISKACEGEVLY